MASDDDEGEGTKGNRKRVPIWSIVKNASFVITAGFFILLIVLSLDAYKFISVRVSSRYLCLVWVGYRGAFRRYCVLRPTPPPPRGMNIKYDLMLIKVNLLYNSCLILIFVPLNISSGILIISSRFFPHPPHSPSSPSKENTRARSSLPPSNTWTRASSRHTRG